MDLTKSILVISTHNVAGEEVFFCGRGLAIATGRRYLGGYIGHDAAQPE